MGVVRSMICVSIGRGRHKQIIAEHQHLVEQGAELCELRLDYVRGAPDLKRLISGRPGPVVITCRRPHDGGRWSGPEEPRIMLLRSAIADGVEYVDLEEDIAASIPRFGATKRIVSYHNFNETPDNLEEIYDRMAKCDPDIIKIATLAHHPRDNTRMLSLMQRSKVPMIGLCMGDIGTPTRILAGKFGAPFTYATFHHERELAPGQLSYRQMLDIYHYNDINAETEIYGVIADPVGHSLSPLLHNAAFREDGLNNVYLPFRVPREDLDDFLADCPKLGVRGLSVTIPHKEAILPHMTRHDNIVERVGAANTIVFRGKEMGAHNTDYRAASEIFDEALSGATSEQPKTALILGAGGVSKAVAHGLKRREMDVVVSSRSDPRAESLAEKLECRWLPWADRYKVRPDVIVNGTPLGMHPDINETPYEGKHFRSSQVVFDTVYNPEQTLFLKEAKEKGCHILTGVDLFVRQAALQYELFTESSAPEDLMRRVLKNATSPVKIPEATEEEDDFG